MRQSRVADFAMVERKLLEVLERRHFAERLVSDIRGEQVERDHFVRRSGAGAVLCAGLADGVQEADLAQGAEIGVAEGDVQPGEALERTQTLETGRGDFGPDEGEG